MYIFASFLIDKDRNINEGLALIDKLLEINPNNYGGLAIKGWGLYKLGKYKEALYYLQKSADLRIKYGFYNHSSYIHLEAAKKAVDGQKNN
jgi:tetratricopeptide (TPR) repeat protein